MAKKRIAADVDLCGNSVENVKNVTASGTVKADTLEGALKGEMLEPVRNRETVAALPYYTYRDLGLTTSATDDEYIQALLKKLVSEHSNLLGMTLIGKTEPNNYRNVILYLYPGEVENDMPRYCSGMVYTGSTGEVYRFWVRNGVFVGKTIVGSTGDLIGARTDHNGNTIATTYATKSDLGNYVKGVTLIDDGGGFKDIGEVDGGYIPLQESEDIQIENYTSPGSNPAIRFSLSEECRSQFGMHHVIAYDAPDSNGLVMPEASDIIDLNDNKVLAVLSSDSVQVSASSATLDTAQQESVDGMKMSVRLAPNGGLESTSNGLKVKQLSDGFYSAPKLILSTDYDADGNIALLIDHPCWGTSGVEFVLMNKSRRTRGGFGTGGYNHKTKDRKYGWTVAMNYRRAAMSYGIARDELTPCVLNDVLDNYNTILQYVKKYYMYPFNTTATAVQTTGIPTTNLYFGGWNMTSNRKTAKVFGIAARRLKSDGKYEYSQPAAILITKTEAKGLRIGV